MEAGGRAGVVDEVEAEDGDADAGHDLGELADAFLVGAVAAADGEVLVVDPHRVAGLDGAGHLTEDAALRPKKGSH